jgi:hypothetical protein
MHSRITLAYLHVADELAKQHQPKNADDDREGYFTDEQALVDRFCP